MSQVAPGAPIVSEVLGIMVRSPDTEFQVTREGGAAEIRPACSGHRPGTTCPAAYH